jgi:hypothetical protein
MTEHGYFHLYAIPVIIGPDLDEQREPDLYRNRGFVDEDAVRGCSARTVPGWDFQDFRVSSQGNLQPDVYGRYLYAIEPVYHRPYEVTRARAERQVATLRKLDRGLARLATRWPVQDPRSYGEYVQRVAMVIGARWMVFGYDAAQTILDLLTGRRELEAIIDRWTRRVGDE